MKWPWQRRVEQAHLEVEQAAAERREVTVALTTRAQKVVSEAVRHRTDNHFREAIENLMRDQA